MSTASTVDLVKTIVARLRAAPYSIARVYVSQAPDNAGFPYVVLRKINAQSAVEYGNTRENFDLEVMCFGSPRSSEQAVEAIADLVIQAMITWAESGPTLGLSFGRSYNRSTLPPSQDPADRELVTVRIVIDCATWPIYTTSVLVP